MGMLYCLLFGFLVSVVCGDIYYTEPEYHASDYSSYRPVSVNKDYADKFKYNNGKYSYGVSRRKCSTYRDYNKKKCPTNGYRPAGHGYGPVCKALPCDFKTNYGFTKCNKRIYLNKEYTRSGRECGHVNGYCDKSPRPGYGGRHAPGNVAYVPNQGGCRCQTIWCMVKTSAVLKDNNPKYGGYKKDTVTISYPCGCQCRAKNIKG